MANTNTEGCRQPDRFCRWGKKSHRRPANNPEEDWGYVAVEARESCIDWSQQVREHYDAEKRILEKFEGPSKSGEGSHLRMQAERLRPEFDALAEQWRRDTRHLSQISKKITHPAYFRITGMGKPVIPLLLESLRDKPTHWFAALRATANVDPCPTGTNPSQARDAWLNWGRTQGYIE